jgi:hypothetical protein
VVQIIDRRELAKGQQAMEVHVYRLPGNPNVVVAKKIYGEPLAYGHRWHMSRLDIPVADAFLDAVRFAEENGIPFVWVNDPHRLFPPDKRPDPAAAERRSRSEDAGQAQGVPFMITGAQRRRLLELGYDEARIRDMTPAEAHQILNVGD